MEHWNPSVAFEVGYALHQERVARAVMGQQKPALAARGPTPRVALALALIALALRIAPR